MRNTIAKAKILELINHSEVALSHSEIEKKLTEGLCNRVTIYRVLDRLTEEGHIHRFYQYRRSSEICIACHHCDAQHHHKSMHTLVVHSVGTVSLSGRCRTCL